jgi:SAM-dependent methyltransferase
MNTLISVKDLIATYRPEDLIASANNYFVNVDRRSLLRKPFTDQSEVSELLLTLTHVMRGLDLPPGSTILDFGAGSCWTSMILAQFGYRVIALDVSLVALEIGRELMGKQTTDFEHPVEFLCFDGTTVDLADASIDGVCCISAFHHVPNPDHIIREFARVLRPWGVVGMSEPGPNHSKTPQSQEEMRNHAVVENDVDIHQIWAVGQQAGFTSLELDLFYPIRFSRPLLDTRPICPALPRWTLRIGCGVS